MKGILGVYTSLKKVNKLQWNNYTIIFISYQVANIIRTKPLNLDILENILIKFINYENNVSIISTLSISLSIELLFTCFFIVFAYSYVP